MDAITKASFWTDTRIEAASPEIKLTCLWLISNPSRDLCGFTKVSNKRFTFETGLDSNWLEGACKGVSSSFLALPCGAYFAVNFIRHQFGKGGHLSLKNNVVKAAAWHAAKLPAPMKAAFFEAYPELLVLLENHHEITPKNNPLTTPLGSTPQGVRVRVRVGEGVGATEEGFGEKPDLVGIVAIYPRNEKRREALDHLAASIRKGADVGAIIAGTRAIAAIIPRLPSGHLNGFVVSSGTFFKDERWRDDPATWLRSAAGKNGAAKEPLNLGGRKVGETIRMNS